MEEKDESRTSSDPQQQGSLQRERRRRLAEESSSEFKNRRFEARTWQTALESRSLSRRASSLRDETFSQLRSSGSDGYAFATLLQREGGTLPWATLGEARLSRRRSMREVSPNSKQRRLPAGEEAFLLRSAGQCSNSRAAFREENSSDSGDLTDARRQSGGRVSEGGVREKAVSSARDPPPKEAFFFPLEKFRRHRRGRSSSRLGMHAESAETEREACAAAFKNDTAERRPLADPLSGGGCLDSGSKSLRSAQSPLRRRSSSRATLERLRELKRNQQRLHEQLIRQRSFGSSSSSDLAAKRANRATIPLSSFSRSSPSSPPASPSGFSEEPRFSSLPKSEASLPLPEELRRLRSRLLEGLRVARSQLAASQREEGNSSPPTQNAASSPRGRRQVRATQTSPPKGETPREKEAQGEAATGAALSSCSSGDCESYSAGKAQAKGASESSRGSRREASESAASPCEEKTPVEESPVAREADAPRCTDSSSLEERSEAHRVIIPLRPCTREGKGVSCASGEDLLRSRSPCSTNSRSAFPTEELSLASSRRRLFPSGSLSAADASCDGDAPSLFAAASSSSSSEARLGVTAASVETPEEVSARDAFGEEVAEKTLLLSVPFSSAAALDSPALTEEEAEAVSAANRVQEVFASKPSSLGSSEVLFHPLEPPFASPPSNSSVAQSPLEEVFGCCEGLPSLLEGRCAIRPAVFKEEAGSALAAQIRAAASSLSGKGRSKAETQGALLSPAKAQTDLETEGTAEGEQKEEEQREEERLRLESFASFAEPLSSWQGPSSMATACAVEETVGSALGEPLASVELVGLRGSTQGDPLGNCRASEEASAASPLSSEECILSPQALLKASAGALSAPSCKTEALAARKPQEDFLGTAVLDSEEIRASFHSLLVASSFLLSLVEGDEEIAARLLKPRLLPPVSGEEKDADLDALEKKAVDAPPFSQEKPSSPLKSVSEALTELSAIPLLLRELAPASPSSAGSRESSLLKASEKALLKSASSPECPYTAALAPGQPCLGASLAETETSPPDPPSSSSASAPASSSCLWVPSRAEARPFPRPATQEAAALSAESLGGDGLKESLLLPRDPETEGFVLCEESTRESQAKRLSCEESAAGFRALLLSDSQGPLPAAAPAECRLQTKGVSPSSTCDKLKTDGSGASAAPSPREESRLQETPTQKEEETPSQKKCFSVSDSGSAVVGAEGAATTTPPESSPKTIEAAGCESKTREKAGQEATALPDAASTKLPSLSPVPPLLFEKCLVAVHSPSSSLANQDTLGKVLFMPRPLAAPPPRRPSLLRPSAKAAVVASQQHQPAKFSFSAAKPSAVCASPSAPAASAAALAAAARRSASSFPQDDSPRLFPSAHFNGFSKASSKDLKTSVALTLAAAAAHRTPSTTASASASASRAVWRGSLSFEDKTKIPLLPPPRSSQSAHSTHSAPCMRRPFSDDSLRDLLTAKQLRRRDSVEGAAATASFGGFAEEASLAETTSNGRGPPHHRAASRKKKLFEKFEFLAALLSSRSRPKERLSGRSAAAAESCERAPRFYASVESPPHNQRRRAMSFSKVQSASEQGSVYGGVSADAAGSADANVNRNQGPPPLPGSTASSVEREECRSRRRRLSAFFCSRFRGREETSRC